jgi:uncharacterized protein
MIIKESFTLSTPPSRVADTLLNVDLVGRCVPGVEDIRRVGADRYEAVLGLQFGPVKPQFSGWLQIDRSSAPDHLAATAEGRDRATGSVAQIGFTADLSEKEPGSTLVVVTANVRIRGRLGQFGTGVIESAAREVLRQFVTCVESSLGETLGGQSRSQVGSFLRIAWAVIRDFFRRLLSRRGDGRESP